MISTVSRNMQCLIASGLTIYFATRRFGPSADHAYMQFIGDDFLRLLMLRFVFCYIVLILHRGFKGPSFYPTSHPPLPTEEITEHPSLYKSVLDLAAILDCRIMFAEPGEGDIHGAT